MAAGNHNRMFRYSDEEVMQVEFFHSQESLTAFEWAIRAVVAYVFMLAAAKMMGQRSISQLRLLDFVIAMLIGNILAHPLSDEHLGMKGSMITMSVLVALYAASITASLKWHRFRHFFESPPFPLIKEGEIIYTNLSKARISVDVLLSEVRKKQVENMQDIALALWEPNGTISIFINPSLKPVTRSDIQLPAKSFTLPQTVIKEKKIDALALKQIGKDEEWLRRKLSEVHKADIQEILLATVDGEENIHVFVYK